MLQESNPLTKWGEIKSNAFLPFNCDRYNGNYISNFYVDFAGKHKSLLNVSMISLRAISLDVFFLSKSNNAHSYGWRWPKKLDSQHFNKFTVCFISDSNWCVIYATKRRLDHFNSAKLILFVSIALLLAILFLFLILWKIKIQNIRVIRTLTQ